MAASAAGSTRPGSGNASQTSILGQSRPLLLPFNRKLRNLKSISLRNLSLDISTPGRPRGRTIDDDADPRAFATPTKLRALREERTLEHSHSSGDLRHDSVLSEQDAPKPGDQTKDHGSPKKVHLNGCSQRKRPTRPRRRSTLDWANASALRRQEKLEHVKEDRMANVFYSLHFDGIQEPIYVSEIADQTMDPSFRTIDSSTWSSGILHSSLVTIRFWTEALSTSKWSLLREWHIKLESLQFLAADIDHAALAFEKNTLLFHFTDGIYTLPNMMPFLLKPSNDSAKRAPPARASSQPQRRSSTFDALLKLAKLTDSIEDALATRDRLAKQLDAVLQANKIALEERDRVTELQDRCKTIVFARDTVTKQITKVKKQLNERRALLQQRRTLLAEDQARREGMTKQIREGQAELPHLQDDRQLRKIVISAQRRRIAEDLSKIYPINSAGGDKALAFKIRGLRLPNAEELDTVSSAEVAASLGLVAHTTQMLSFYLGVPLPYHLHCMGSTSWITDPISLVSGTTGAASTIANALRSNEDKVYPLYSSRVARFRFDYGVFLLNKDIQLLLESAFGVRVLDIRHTLPNLKYLFYVATAGEGELPARKAGGIRGLVKHSPRGSLSRGSSSGSLPGWINKVTGKEEKRELKDAAQSLRQLVKD